MDELLSEFLTEANESLADLDNGLLRLEQNPNDLELLSEIFRVVHTIKGTCGFLGLPRLGAVAHVAEDVLGKFRDGDLAVTPDSVTVIFEALDCLKSLLGHLEETEKEPEGNDDEIIARLREIADAAGPEVTAEDMEAAFEAASAKPQEEIMSSAQDSQAELDKAVAVVKQECAAEVEAATATPAKRKSAAANESASPVESKIASQNIRVGVDLLEHLMTMVSELVLTRNQLLQMVRGQTDTEFADPLNRLSHVTTELQEGVMKTRMQPIGKAWAKLPRIIRDLAIDLDKKINLKMIGEDTELDRQVLELIKDPLTHMVRNSADHGIESPEVRRAAGKPETGTVTLKAYHEGGHINIELHDDGAGIDIEAVKKKALETGVVTESQLDSMSEQHILQLIFKPGFSTATEVTSVSGRGVGMDVVKTNVEKIGGNVELSSIPGEGSTFVIKIPLTLAIVSALIVEASDQRFAIPQISVIELVRAAGNAEHTVEMLNDAPVLRLRDRLLPLVSLSQVLRLDEEQKEFDTESETFIVVSQVGTYSFGIIVDRVFDTEEIVVKPVAPMMRDIGVFSGNTILGDGSIVMILDPNGLAAAGGDSSIASGAEADDADDAGTASSDQTTALLVFKSGPGAPRAVPLSLVARLEEIERKDIEFSDGKPVVQYRGKLMPLVLSHDDDQSIEGDGKVSIVVFSEEGRSMGLVVDEIVDIVDDVLNIEISATQPGITGSAIVDGKATDIIDAGYYLTQAYSDWFQSQAARSNTEGAPRRLLLVDDSPFFRNLLAPLLSAAGYDVTMADGGDEALTILESDSEFDIIVSDIEMPGTNGFDLVKACRSNDRWKETPIVALSSHTTPVDLDRGRDAGFTDYIAKSDRDGLLTALSQSLMITGDAA